MYALGTVVEDVRVRGVRLQPKRLGGEIYVVCQAFKEASEGDIQAVLPGRFQVQGVADLKSQRGLSSSSKV